MPVTFNAEIHITLLFSFEVPDIFTLPLHLILPSLSILKRPPTVPGASISNKPNPPILSALVLLFVELPFILIYISTARLIPLVAATEPTPKFPPVVNWLLHETFPDKVVIPLTFNNDMHVVALFNVVAPDTFNVDINVEGLLKLTIEGGFNIALYFKSVNAVPEPIYYLLYLMMIAMLMH